MGGENWPNICSKQDMDGAVCSSWRHVAEEYCRRNVCSKTPWLLFPITPIEKTWRDSYKRPDKKTRYGLLNLSQPKVYNLELPDDIQNTYFFVAAYKSWLLLSYADGTSLLLNPFTSSKVMLPPTKNICVLSISKFVISESEEGEESNNRDNFTIMAIHGSQNKVAYCKPGDESWTLIDHRSLNDIVDLMFHKGYFYALDELRGVAKICLEVEGEGSSSSPPIQQIRSRDHTDKPPWQYRYNLSESFIVGSSEKILLIKRNNDKYQTIGFEVFELDDSCREWVQVRRLPNNSALFVGKNFSASISLSEPNSSSKYCRANCIYFVDHYKRFPVVFHDVAAFDLQDGGIQHLPYAQGVLDIGMNFLQGDAVWITPSLS